MKKLMNIIMNINWDFSSPTASLATIRQLGLFVMMMLLTASVLIAICLYFIEIDDSNRELIVIFISRFLVVAFSIWISIIILSNYYEKSYQFLDMLWITLVLLLVKFLLILTVGDNQLMNGIGKTFNMFISKKELLSYFSIVMGGVVTAIAASALCLTYNAHSRKSRWDGFKSATQNIQSESLLTRISTYYQLYQLAKEEEDIEFKQDILNILCIRWCEVLEKEKIDNTTEESQELSRILIKFKDKLKITCPHVGDYQKNCDDQNYLAAICQK